MFPVANSIIAISILIGILMGAIAGSLSGLVLSFLFKLSRRGVWKDSALGSLGYVVGWAIFFLFLWWFKYSPNPVITSFGLAVLLPAIREVYRFSQAKASVARELN
ncbi:MAG TPA: hypothetical protein VGG46_06355 [Terriglobales bacterium]|jgi:hypothetical protein